MAKFMSTATGEVLNLNRISLVKAEPAGAEGDGGYRIVAYDRIPRNAQYAPNVVICRVENYEAAQRWLASFATSRND